MNKEDYNKYIESVMSMTKTELQQQLLAFYKSSILSGEIKEKLKQEIELRDMKISQLEEEIAMLRMFGGGRNK